MMCQWMVSMLTILVNINKGAKLVEVELPCNALQRVGPLLVSHKCIDIYGVDVVYVNA